MTGAVALLWRTRLRRSGARVVLLAFVLAIGSGTALASLAGARRTAGAFDNVLTITNSGELGTSYVSTDVEETRGRFRDFDIVEDFSQRAGFIVLTPDRPLAGLNTFGYYNDPIEVERPLLLEGRMAETATEMVVTESALDGLGAKVGDEIEIALPNQDFSSFETERMTIVGTMALSVYPDETEAAPGFVFAKAFVERHVDDVAWGAVVMTFEPGVTSQQATTELLERGLVIDDDRSLDRRLAANAIRPLVVTFAAFGALALIAVLVVVGQGVRRIVRRSAADDRSLAAIGFDRRMLGRADALMTATVGIAGAIGGVAVAAASSPIFPQGRARRIPQLRGVDVDVAVLGLGAVAVVAGLHVVVSLASRWPVHARSARAGVAPAALANSVAASTGARFATGRRGLGAAVAGTAVGLAVVVAAVTFTGSVDRLVTTPALSGFTWDLLGREAYTVIDTDGVARTLADVPEVERISGLEFGDAEIAGDPVAVSVWSAVKGSPWPSILEGRAPQTPGEALLGAKTLRAIGANIGDTITIQFNRGDQSREGAVPVDLTIVGTAVSPPVPVAGADVARLDEGLLVQRSDVPDGFVFGGAVLFDLRDGADPGIIRNLFPEGLPDDTGVGTEWFNAATPAEVDQAAAADGVLRVSIAVLLLAVVATVAHNLLGFVRERRRSFAVLKALGFTPRQIRATVLWHSGLVLLAAVLVATPIGIAAGRWLYQGFAGGIGVIVQPVVPAIALAAALAVTVLLVQGVALVPATQARRTNAARELRPE